MKYFLIIPLLLVLSLIITVYLGESYVFEKDLEGKYPYIKELSYYPPGNTEKRNALVGGWPFYWLIDEPWHSVQNKVSIQDFIILPIFLLNWFLFFMTFFIVFLLLNKLRALMKEYD